MAVSEADEIEPIRGLPQDLPEGEQILWQGEPTTESIAKKVFHVRLVIAYFAALLVWRIASGVHDGLPLDQIAQSAGMLCVPLAAGLGLLQFLAWGIAKTTVYTVTNRRVVIRAGVALAKSINIPFAQIAAAQAKRHKDGTWDLPLQLTGKNRFAYLVLWPHVQPLAWTTTKPMLRGLADGERVAHLLADALTRYHGGNGTPASVAQAGQNAGQDTGQTAGQDTAPGLPPAAVPAE